MSSALRLDGLEMFLFVLIADCAALSPSPQVPSERMAKVAVEELYPLPGEMLLHDRLPIALG